MNITLNINLPAGADAPATVETPAPAIATLPTPELTDLTVDLGAHKRTVALAAHALGLSTVPEVDLEALVAHIRHLAAGERHNEGELNRLSNEITENEETIANLRRDNVALLSKAEFAKEAVALVEHLSGLVDGEDLSEAVSGLIEERDGAATILKLIAAAVMPKATDGEALDLDELLDAVRKLKTELGERGASVIEHRRRADDLAAELAGVRDEAAEARNAGRLNQGDRNTLLNGLSALAAKLGLPDTDIAMKDIPAAALPKIDALIAAAKAGQTEAPAPAPAIDEIDDVPLPPNITRREYKAWAIRMREQGVTENVDPQEYKRLRDAGLIDWAFLKANGSALVEPAELVGVEPAEGEAPAVEGAIAYPEVGTQGLKIGGDIHFEGAGKKLVLERVQHRQPHAGFASNDVERYVVKTPRDRVIGQFALGTDGKWTAEVSFYPSPALDTFDDALSWIYARDKYTGGTSPSDQAKKQKGDAGPVETVVEADMLPPGAYVSFDGVPEHNIPAGSGSIVGSTKVFGEPGYIVERGSDLGRVALRHRNVTLVSGPMRSSAPSAFPFAHAWVVLDFTRDGAHHVGRARLARATNIGGTPAYEVVGSEIEGLTVIETSAIAEVLPSAALYPGEPVTVIDDEGRIADGDIARLFPGTTRYEVRIERGGCLVRDSAEIGGRAPVTACPDCGGGPGLSHTCSCVPSEDRVPVFNI